MRARASADAKERVANIIAVANIGKLQSAQSAETFLQGKEIRERLARMIAVGKRVNHRYGRVFRQRINRFLRERSRHDSLNPTFEIFCHVGNGFALTQSRFRMIEKNRSATEARYSDFESNARAQRRLFKNQCEETARKSSAIAVGMGLHIRGEMEEFAYLRGTPLHPGQKVVR